MFDNFTESTHVAVVQTAPNTLAWLPVYLDSENNPFIRKDSAWIPVTQVRGFRRYEKARRKRLLDSATLELVEV